MRRRTAFLRTLLAGALWCTAGTATALETTDELQARLLGEQPTVTATAETTATLEPNDTPEISEAAPAGPEETLGDVFRPGIDDVEAADAMPFSTLMSQPTAADQADATSSRWNWVFGLLVLVAGCLMLFNKGKLGTLPGATHNLRVLDRTTLGRDGSITMLEVHDSSGTVRRVLIGASNGSSPRMLMELESTSSAIDAEQVSQDKQETLALLEEMMGERGDTTPQPHLVEAPTLQPVTNDSDFNTRLNEAVSGPGDLEREEARVSEIERLLSEPALPAATITRPSPGEHAEPTPPKRHGSVLPFERVLAATMDDEPDPDSPRPRRGRWEVIA